MAETKDNPSPILPRFAPKTLEISRNMIFRGEARGRIGRPSMGVALRRFIPRKIGDGVI